MSAGLAALLDDVAALAKMAAATIDDVSVAAAKAGTKAAGVIVDDAAVTPQYVAGVAAERELPIIRKIAMGSLRNKAMIVPAVLAMSVFLPQILTPLLMLGGLYLCFEGAEKIWEKVSGHEPKADKPAAVKGSAAEDTLVAGAVRTDFILSAEILVIALNEVATQPLVTRSIVMVVVALMITVIVYGAVAIIVKMDDVGLRMMDTDNPAAQSTGRAIVNAMPHFLTGLTIVGTAAMLWVGGHILLDGAKKLGWASPYNWVHDVEVAAGELIPAIGGFVAWLTNTGISAVVGLLAGGIIVAILHVLPIGHGKDDEAEPEQHDGDGQDAAALSS